MKAKKKKVKQKERYIAICPKCGSSNVKAETNPIYGATGLSTQFKQCNNCGHHGQVFPEVLESKVPKKVKKPEEVKEKQQVQTSFGKGYYKFLLYVIAPILVILVILLFVL